MKYRITKPAPLHGRTDDKCERLRLDISRLVDELVIALEGYEREMQRLRKEIERRGK